MNVLEEKRLKTNLRAITSDLIKNEYIRYEMDEKGVKHATIASTLRALRAFFNWAKGKIVDKNPLDDIVIGDPKAPEINTFTRDQIRDILSQPDLKMFAGLRDFTIMMTFLETGVRVRELCDIKVNDVRFADDQILIHSKNREDRLVPIQTQTRHALKRYIKTRGQSPVDWIVMKISGHKMNRVR